MFTVPLIPTERPLAYPFASLLLPSVDFSRKLYAKSYKRYQARLSRGAIDEEAFEAWKTTAKQYLSDIQNDRISVEEYQAWMES